MMQDQDNAKVAPEETPLDEIVSLWGIEPGTWQVVGEVAGILGSERRPIIGIGAERYLVRRQPPDLTENDTRFRHAFMRHLRANELPVPALRLRPDGHSYAIVAGGIYEMQEWLDGRRYITGEAGDGDRLEAAARTLGMLHQASADFEWQPHTWPEERSPAAISNAYIELIRQRSTTSALPQTLANGLARVAEGCAARLAMAIAALEEPPGPPELPIHGDYQPHNLAFGPASVTAIYDFDAAHWAWRIDEVAYSLLFFAGVRWDETPTVTPPLVDDGFDVLRLHRFLNAYGREAPPAEGEARLLADALTLAFPVVFVNGIAEDLIFAEDFEGEPDEEEAMNRLQWADTFWLWLDRYRDILAQAWETA